MSIYRFQTFKEESKKCCTYVGCHCDVQRSSFDYERSIKKVLSGNWKSVLLPCSFETTPDANTIIEELIHNNIEVVAPIRLENCNFFSRYKCKKIFYMTTGEREELGEVELLKERNVSFKVIHIVTTGHIPKIEDLKRINDLGVESFFYFPTKERLGDGVLSCFQVYKFINKMNYHDFEVKPLPGLSVYERRAPIDLEFEPLFEPKINLSVPGAEVHVSIVIPIYNQKDYLKRTLEHLEKQSYPLEGFEVVIVDDGGNDGLEEIINSFDSKLNLKYIYFPRCIGRTMGDFRFRAGISRNLGVKNSSGNYLFFLDADVIVPKDYISTLLEELKESDLVQIQRYDLKKKSTESLESIEKINHDSDVITIGRDYWYDFFSSRKKWNEREDAWKYVCSYGIGLKRDLFEAVGGFPVNYVSYGFEDTDLGYKIFNNKKIFKLSRIRGYHLFHGDERSEFKNSFRQRQKVLARTGKVFFLNYLDKEIFDVLRDYMKERYSLLEIMLFVLKKISPKKTPRPITNSSIMRKSVDFS